jgi:hypothetical protein
MSVLVRSIEFGLSCVEFGDNRAHVARLLKLITCSVSSGQLNIILGGVLPSSDNRAFSEHEALSNDPRSPMLRAVTDCLKSRVVASAAMQVDVLPKLQKPRRSVSQYLNVYCQRLTKHITRKQVPLMRDDRRINFYGLLFATLFVNSINLHNPPGRIKPRGLLSL